MLRWRTVAVLMVAHVLAMWRWVVTETTAYEVYVAQCVAPSPTIVPWIGLRRRDRRRRVERDVVKTKEPMSFGTWWWDTNTDDTAAALVPMFLALALAIVAVASHGGGVVPVKNDDHIFEDDDEFDEEERKDEFQPPTVRVSVDGLEGKAMSVDELRSRLMEEVPTRRRAVGTAVVFAAVRCSGVKHLGLRATSALCVGFVTFIIIEALESAEAVHKRRLRYAELHAELTTRKTLMIGRHIEHLQAWLALRRGRSALHMDPLERSADAIAGTALNVVAGLTLVVCRVVSFELLLAWAVLVSKVLQFLDLGAKTNELFGDATRIRVESIKLNLRIQRTNTDLAASKAAVAQERKRNLLVEKKLHRHLQKTSSFRSSNQTATTTWTTSSTSYPRSIQFPAIRRNDPDDPHVTTSRVSTHGAASTRSLRSSETDLSSEAPSEESLSLDDDRPRPDDQTIIRLAAKKARLLANLDALRMAADLLTDVSDRPSILAGVRTNALFSNIVRSLVYFLGVLTVARNHLSSFRGSPS